MRVLPESSHRSGEDLGCSKTRVVGRLIAVWHGICSDWGMMIASHSRSQEEIGAHRCFDVSVSGHSLTKGGQ
jgi:hypothetical protein